MTNSSEHYREGIDDAKKVENDFYGRSNEYTDKIRLLANNMIHGSAEKVDAIKIYIVDEAAKINAQIADKCTKDFEATTDPVRRAQIVEAGKAMLERRLRAFKAMFFSGEPKTYEDLARAADLYRASSELAREETLTCMIERIASGAPLKPDQLNMLVDLVDGEKLTNHAKNVGNIDVGQDARQYLQVGIGAMLYKMCFEQKVVFAQAYANKKGFEKFNQLADVMMFSGGLAPNDYKELLIQLVQKPLNAPEMIKAQAQLAKFNDPQYLKETADMAKAGLEAYEKAAKDMRQDYATNPFERAMTGKNLLNVVGTVVLSATVIFNGLAIYTGNKTWGERLAAVPRNLPLMGAGAGLAAIASGGSAKVAAEKFTPSQRAELERKDARLASRVTLLEQHNTDLPFADWLDKGGMNVLLAYHQHIREGYTTLDNTDPKSIEGKRKYYAANPSLLDKTKLVEFLSGDLSKQIPNREALKAQLEKLSISDSDKSKFDEKLTKTLKTALAGRIYSQGDYADLIKDYHDNRDKYKDYI